MKVTIETLRITEDIKTMTNFLESVNKFFLLNQSTPNRKKLFKSIKQLIPLIHQIIKDETYEEIKEIPNTYDIWQGEVPPMFPEDEGRSLPPKLIASDIKAFSFPEACSIWYHTTPDSSSYGELTYDISNKPRLYGIPLYSSKEEAYSNIKYSKK